MDNRDIVQDGKFPHLGGRAYKFIEIHFAKPRVCYLYVLVYLFLTKPSFITSSLYNVSKRFHALTYTTLHDSINAAKIQVKI